MSPIDQASLDSGTPTTTDGRRYPAHLRAYEQFDAALLPLVAAIGGGRLDDIASAAPSARLRASVPRWLASAEWRGLVERVDVVTGGPRRFRLTERGLGAVRSSG